MSDHASDSTAPPTKAKPHTQEQTTPGSSTHTRLHAFCNSTSVPSPVATPAWTTCMGQALFSLMHREGTKAQGGQVILWQICVSSTARAQAQVCLQFTSGQQSASAEGLQGGVFPWPGPHPRPRVSSATLLGLAPQAWGQHLMGQTCPTWDLLPQGARWKGQGHR